MTEIYNLTNISSSSNFLELTQHANSLSGGLFGTLVILSFFIVLFVSLHGEMRIKFAAASFITAIITLLFSVIGLIGEFIVLIIVFMTAVSVMFAMYKQD